MYILPQTLRESRTEQNIIFDILLAVILVIPAIIFSMLLIDRPNIGRKNTCFFAFLSAAILMFICIFKEPDRKFVYLVSMSKAMAVIQSNFLFVYTCEYFPTKIRSTALSQLATWSRTAGIISPLLCTVIGEIWIHFPYGLYFVILALGAALNWMLDVDTLGRHLDTVEENVKN